MDFQNLVAPVWRLCFGAGSHLLEKRLGNEVHGPKDGARIRLVCSSGGFKVLWMTDDMEGTGSPGYGTPIEQQTRAHDKEYVIKRPLPEVA